MHFYKKTTRISEKSHQFSTIFRAFLEFNGPLSRIAYPRSTDRLIWRFQILLGPVRDIQIFAGASLVRLIPWWVSDSDNER